MVRETQNKRKWRRSRDPLWRGDSAAGVRIPAPRADRSIVRHVLYLDGPGRDTPYHSTTERHEVAEHFAGGTGARVYETSAPAAELLGVSALSKIELLSLLKGKGKGDATWPSAVEVLQARKYVEQWSEHLLEFSELPDSADLPTIVKSLYK